MNGPVLAEIIRIVGRCLVSVRSVAHLIGVMDCCPVHCTVPVLRAAASVPMHVLFVPSSMTGVLQPLDAYTFSLFKRPLREQVYMMQHQSRYGSAANKEVVLATFDVAVQTLNCQNWSRSFIGCGFSDGQDSLGGRVMRYLQWNTSPIGTDASLPTLEELQCIFPRNRLIPVGWLFSVAKQADEGTTRLTGADSVEGHGRVDVRGDWCGRLRSSSGSRGTLSVVIPCLVPGAADGQWPPLPPPALPPPQEEQELTPSRSPEARYWAQGVQLQSLRPLGRQRPHPHP